MITLGLNAAFHDSAAALVQDGRVVAAAEEERFTRIKHGKRPLPFTTWELPFHAVDYCLAEAGIELAQLDHVAYSYDPKILLESHAREEKIVEHHLAHEASAFLAAPFAESAVMTLDGRGELATTTYGHFDGGRFERLGEVRMPHSLGLLYEEITDYLGFLRSSDEYKVMALASYGTPDYARAFREIISIGEAGRYEIRKPELVRRFGPARARGAALTRKHFDIARSLQLVLEETAVVLAAWLKDKSASDNLCMAGGVALNCVMNARIRDAGLFEQVWVQPAAGDAGTALGAALWTDWQARHGSPGFERTWQMEHAFFGPGFADGEIEAFLRRSHLKFRRMENVAEETARVLAEDRIVGWFQGRMEFGPRALGGRSILASPLSADMQQRLNEIKDREDFRPVAPVVLEEEAANWFVGGANLISPFMLFVYDIAPGKAARIPAVRHVDGTARIQTINRAQHPLYYDLVDAFHRRTGVPVLVNTSFNTRGEPVVCTPRDALECFWTSPIDALAIGSFLLEK